MSRGFASNYRIVLLATGLFACFAGLGARLVCLHVIDREALLSKLVRTRRQTTLETAKRGDIFDRTGSRLATSRPVIVVAVDPSIVTDQDLTQLPKLAPLLGMPLAEVTRIFKTKYKLVTRPAAPAAAAKPAAAGATLTLNLPPPAPAKPEAGDDANSDPEFGRSIVAANATPTPLDSADAKATASDDEVETDDSDESAGRRIIRWAPLSKNVSESNWAEIQKLGIKSLCAPERSYARVYPHDELASHLVGFANRANVGQAGIEAYADFYLRGQDGWREGEKDGRRHELAQFQTREIPCADGYSVKLSIDATIQDIAERELDKIAKTYEPKKATIIISDPRTGFILAMANYPTFNPNEYAKTEMGKMRNIAVADVYEPGSVFKIVAASAALEEGLVTPQTQFNCGLTTINYLGRDLKMPGEDHHFGELTVAEIIAHSSNRGAAQLAMELGADRFEKYARAFGFGSTLGFPVGHESPGIFHPHEKWYPIDITRIPMGQSIAATALQMHAAMSTVANGGVLMRPQVIQEIRDAQGNIVYRYTPQPIRRVISERTAATVARLLQGVASKDGTAPGAAINLNGIDYEVAGKTGTAQKYLPEVQPSGRVKIVPSKKHHVVSFVGFFPASRPQVAISVIVDDADAHATNGVAYGAAVAAPVFKSIGEKLIPILPIIQPNQAARLELAATEGGRR